MNKEEREAVFGNFNILETEVAIKFIKDSFERELADALNLTRVSAPLFVFPETGLNDNLNGIERPVEFDILDIGKRNVQVVQSLAKWKRLALKKYGFTIGTGLYTDMNAIRRDETLDAIHSIYVDQWDWEKVINPEERNLHTLKNAVKDIYEALKETQFKLCGRFGGMKPFLPEEITFVSTQELEDVYPNYSPKEREDAVTKKYGAVFLCRSAFRLKAENPMTEERLTMMTGCSTEISLSGTRCSSTHSKFLLWE